MKDILQRRIRCRIEKEGIDDYPDWEREMAITQCISGGQTGADQGGLLAALALQQQGFEIKMGGTAPHGWRTEAGPSIKLLKDLYGLIEHESAGYSARTRQNVLDSDGTIIFCSTIPSAGSKMTERYCKEFNKPCFIFTYPIQAGSLEYNASCDDAAMWARSHNVSILNVAGNRESVNPGIFIFTAKTIVNIIMLTNNYYDLDRLSQAKKTVLDIGAKQYAR